MNAGPTVRVYLIAEMASAHDGDLRKARQLIRLSAAAGADAVKAQYWSSADRLADRRHVPDDYRALYHRYRMPRAWLDALAETCAQSRVDFLCSTYLPEDIAVVAPYVTAMKVASFEAGDRAFLEANRATGKPLIVSVGMMASRAVTALAEWLVEGDALLHCVSAYPCPIAAANLRAITSRTQAHPQYRVGYSDHTAHWLTGALAVAAGAEVLETHVRLWDTDRANPDFASGISLDYSGNYNYATYVGLVRHAEEALGDGQKVDGSHNPAEQAMNLYRVRS